MANAPFYGVGLHQGQIVGQGFTKAKSTGNLQLMLQVKILGVPEGNSYIPHQQQYTRTIYYALTDKTAPFVIEALKTLGYEGETISQLDPGHKSHVSLVGRQCDLWCSYEANQDNTGERERWSISKGAQEIEPMDGKALRQLDSLFGKAFSGGAKVKAAQPAVTEAQHEQPKDGRYFDNSPEITDEDIPF
jgi:hypothetical protein